MAYSARHVCCILGAQFTPDFRFFLNLGNRTPMIQMISMNCIAFEDSQSANPVVPRPHIGVGLRNPFIPTRELRAADERQVEPWREKSADFVSDSGDLPRCSQ